MREYDESDDSLPGAIHVRQLRPHILRIPPLLPAYEREAHGYARSGLCCEYAVRRSHPAPRYPNRSHRSLGLHVEEKSERYKDPGKNRCLRHKLVLPLNCFYPLTKLANLAESLLLFSFP